MMAKKICKCKLGNSSSDTITNSQTRGLVITKAGKTTTFFQVKHHSREFHAQEVEDISTSMKLEANNAAKHCRVVVHITNKDQE